MSRSFTARLVLPATAGAALVIGLGLLIDYQLSRARILEEVEGRARSGIMAASGRLQEMGAGVESSLRLLSSALGDVPEASRIDELLRSTVDSNPHIFAAAIALDPALSETGQGFAPYVYRSATGLSETNLSQRQNTPYWEQPWYQRAREQGRPGWVEPYFEPSGAKVLMTTFSAPLFRAADNGLAEFWGVASIDVALADLYEYLDALRVGDLGYGFLLTRQGTYIGAPKGKVISGPAAELLGTDIVAQWTEHRAEGSPLRSTLPCPRAGNLCQLRLQSGSANRWSIGVVFSEENLLQPLRDYRLRVLLLGLIMLAVLAAVISLVARQLATPLIGLARASDAIAKGELDVALPPASATREMQTLLNAFDRMRRDLRHYIDEIESAAAKRSRMQAELSAARDIQMAMLPQNGDAFTREKHFQLWAKVRPARSVGGDLYSYSHDDNTLLFCVGDVSDKGVPAALFMARAMSFIQRWEAQTPAVPPDRALAQLNDALSRDNDNCMFLTLCVGTLNLHSGALRYASAGHSAPLRCRDGRVTALDQQRGPALGLRESLLFPINETVLQHRDRLMLYTDGFDEAHNNADELLGEPALLRAFEELAGVPLTTVGPDLFTVADTHSAGAAQSDDMTLMLIAFDELSEDPPQRQRIELPIDDSVVRRAASWLEAQWQALALEPDKLMSMQLVQEELLCNIRKHAQTPPGSHVTLELQLNDAGIELVFQDPGIAYDPLLDAPRAVLGQATQDAAIGGLGVHLITRLSDRQSYRRETDSNILTVWMSSATAVPNIGNNKE